MARPLRPRGSLRFEKPPLGLDDLVDRLVDRGLAVPDRDRARRYLRHIARIVDADVCASPEHLRPPRPALERRTRCLSGDSHLADGVLARARRSAAGEIENAPVSGPRVVAVDPRVGFPAQRVGTQAPPAARREAADESARHGCSGRLGRRPVLEPADLLTEPAAGAPAAAALGRCAAASPRRGGVRWWRPWPSSRR